MIYLIIFIYFHILFILVSYNKLHCYYMLLQLIHLHVPGREKDYRI
jgi:hypothetical protein